MKGLKDLVEAGGLRGLSFHLSASLKGALVELLAAIPDAVPHSHLRECQSRCRTIFSSRDKFELRAFETLSFLGS